MKLLLVKTAPSAMVADQLALDAGVRRFINRVFNPASNSWDILPEASEVPYCAEYHRAVQDKDLIPQNQETADLCGVKFSPPKPVK